MKNWFLMSCLYWLGMAAAWNVQHNDFVDLKFWIILTPIAAAVGWVMNRLNDRMEK